MTSPACCNMPPVEVDYKSKGRTEKILDDMNAYVTGPETSEKVIVGIYDVFGCWSTTEQGADILAQLTGMKVVLPDFFRGEPLPNDSFPMDTPEKQQIVNNFLGTKGNPMTVKGDLMQVSQKLKANGAKSIGVYGLCWGSKPATLACSEKETPFAAIAQLHPSLLDAKDASALQVPMASLTSKDEPEELMKDFYANLKANSAIASRCIDHHYPDIPHGFAGSRANLKDQANLEAYKDAYQRTAKFFVDVL